jgi:hypothetical protein
VPRQPTKAGAWPETPNESAPERPPALAARLLMAARTGNQEMAAVSETALASLSPDALAGALVEDPSRIAFWVNVYNAATQRLVAADPAAHARRLRFLRKRAIVVAGQSLSLDAIEHGILRRSRWRFGLGYVGNPFYGDFERRYRVDQVDPRIHFALNCAARSCPPIAAYVAGNLDVQLDVATRAYLATSVRERPGQLDVPRVFLWFAGDFGGRAGIRRFLTRYGIDPSRRRLRFARFDWSLEPDAWTPTSGLDVPPGT